MFDIKGHVKNTFIMKTATAQDLLFRLPMVLAWLEAGEEVVVKPKAVHHGVPKQTKPAADWSQSAAFRDRRGERVLTSEETAELYESFKGDY